MLRAIEELAAVQAIIPVAFESFGGELARFSLAIGWNGGDLLAHGFDEPLRFLWRHGHHIEHTRVASCDGAA